MISYEYFLKKWWKSANRFSWLSLKVLQINPRKSLWGIFSTYSIDWDWFQLKKYKSKENYFFYSPTETGVVWRLKVLQIWWAWNMWCRKYRYKTYQNYIDFRRVDWEILSGENPQKHRFWPFQPSLAHFEALADDFRGFICITFRDNQEHPGKIVRGFSPFFQKKFIRNI